MASMPWGIFVLFLYFLPIYQSLSLIVQFYGKCYHFALVGIERLGILLGSYLLGCGINACVDCRSWFLRMDNVGNTISFKACFTSKLGIPRK